jgi:predicted nucleic acid-binding protein
VGALVDSSVLIAATNNERFSAWARAAIGSYLDFFVSPIVLSELQVGCHTASDVDNALLRRQALQYALDATCLDVTPATAAAHASLRTELLRAGKTRSRGNDLWLAATAREHQLDLLTCNPRDFADVTGLHVVSPNLSE